jgi:release factor glutamine methyltransferase
MEIYQPAEDSYFLSEIALNYLENKNKILDMGTGSGFQSENLIKNKVDSNKIIAVDINPLAIKQAGNLKIKTIKSDLFSNIIGKFDLILFNPPYLPEDNLDSEIDTTGGKSGDEIILRFIERLPNHLEKEGVCLLLTSSFTPENKFLSLAKNKKLQIKKIAEKNLFFEKLYILEITLLQ